MNKQKLLYAGLLLGGVLLVESCRKDEITNQNGINEMPDPYASMKDGDLIPNEYIVVFRENFAQEVKSKMPRGLSYEAHLRIASEEGKKVLKERNIPAVAMHRSYGATIVGFAATLDAAQVDNLKSDPRVAFVEQDRIVSISQNKTISVNGKPSGGGSGGSTPSPAQVTPWGVRRVGTSSATDKTAWIIDTGIDFTHPDLNVNTTKSKSYVTSGANASSANDQNGHGTHVAGTIAAKNNTIGVVGVAAGATVVAVRVLNRQGTGTYSAIIAGVDYVGANASSGDVANMSLGGSASLALDNSVTKAAAKGILFSIAAGNSSANSNNFSPARVNGTNIYTISAMDSSDRFASFSNYANPPIDYCEPGVYIYSTYMGGGYATLSGTSMAAPHMAGILLVKGSSFTTSGSVKNDPDGSADPIGHL